MIPHCELEPPDHTSSLEYKMLFEAYIEALAKAEKLAEAHEAIVSAKVSGCVEHKGCECWWQTSQKALAEFQKWKAGEEQKTYGMKEDEA